MTNVKRLDAIELWETMRKTNFPFALIDPVTHLFVDANDQYAALFEMDAEEMKGVSVISMYPPELSQSMESMLGAFARGTLQVARGQVSLQRSNRETVDLNGWSRRIEGLSERPLVVTSAVDTKGDATLPDDRYWVAQAPEVFGLATELSWSAEDDAARRADQLEQHMWRMAQEIRAAGFIPAADETFFLDSIGEFGELTTRQREIVTRLLAGERVGGIARDMYLSPSTIRNHLSAVFRKFGVHSQVELISLLKNPSGSP